MEDFPRAISQIRLDLMVKTRSMSAAETVRWFDKAIREVPRDPILGSDSLTARRLLLLHLVLLLFRL